MGLLTRRLAAVSLLAQAMSVFFGALVAWQLMGAGGAPERGRTALWLGSALALLCVLAAGLLRSRAGVTLGWVCQVATLVSGLVFRPMLLVGLIFGALWWASLRYGHRIDTDRAAWAAQGEES